MKITPAIRRVLEYVRDNEPIGLFPMPRASLLRAAAAGYVEQCGRETGQFGFVKYRLTNTGHEALKTAAKTS